MKASDINPDYLRKRGIEVPQVRRRVRIGSLFAGVGGLELGIEWGLGHAETIWQVEYEEHARLVLAQHWPEAERHQDVRHVDKHNLAPVDLICGGPPCQPHSLAGKRQASNDDRDLWHEFARIVSEVKPRWVVVENVPGFLSSADPAFSRDHAGGFFGRVLRDLAEMGFDAEWACFPAASVGAYHLRNRVFLIAWNMAHPLPPGRQEQHATALTTGARHDTGGGGALRNPAGEGLPDWAGGAVGQPSPLPELERPGGREVERDFRGVPHGVSLRMDRLTRLGNGVVPQQAAVIGRAVKDAQAHWERCGVMPERIVRPEHWGQA